METIPRAAELPQTKPHIIRSHLAPCLVKYGANPKRIERILPTSSALKVIRVESNPTLSEDKCFTYIKFVVNEITITIERIIEIDYGNCAFFGIVTG